MEQTLFNWTNIVVLSTAALAALGSLVWAALALVHRARHSRK